VACLIRLVAAAKHDDQRRASLHEIDPIAGPVVDPQLRKGRPYGFDIAAIAERQTAQTLGYSRCRPSVSQAHQPSRERLGLANLDHVAM